MCVIKDFYVLYSMNCFVAGNTGWMETQRFFSTAMRSSMGSLCGWESSSKLAPHD